MSIFWDFINASKAAGPQTVMYWSGISPDSCFNKGLIDSISVIPNEFLRDINMSNPTMTMNP